MTPEGKIVLLSLIIWWAAASLEGLILFRGFQTKLIRKYPLFYLQVALTLAVGIVLSAVYEIRPLKYRELYWATEFLEDLIQCAVILEILRYVLPARRSSDNLTTFLWLAFYAGALYLAIAYTSMTTFLACVIVVEIARYLRSGRASTETFARFVRLAIFVAIICCAAAYLLLRPEPSRVTLTYSALERDFSAILAILLLVVLGGILRYRPPMGRNLKGIFLGYGCMVAGALIVSGLLSSLRFSLLISILSQLPFTIALAIWLVTLWAAHPQPMPAESHRHLPSFEKLREDYKSRPWRYHAERLLAHFARSGMAHK